MPLEHEAVGTDPFVDREQTSARVDCARRVKGLDQSDKQFNSIVCHQKGPWRQAAEAKLRLTEESTEQEATERTLLAIHPGKFLSIA
ncbi:hypothetical protein S23_57840 [Bradyrhizobium cosmicum]|uniref:Uncharacterized protein n=1 Tax=Bradyrhizobium cosmicum TaxID=1404864 RepID=A0AAI8MIT6_9BRAD|nr:hypothetical protein S23_57840 [Bradyrhizobium cosmicum]